MHETRAAIPVATLTDAGPPLRVLHVRRLFSLLSESFIWDGITAQRRAGIHAEVLTLLRIRGGDEDLPTRALLRLPQLHRAGSATRGLARWIFRHAQPDVRIWPLLHPLLRRHVAGAAPDVVHAHFGPDGCLIEPIARELGVPLVVTFYGYDVSRLIEQDGAYWRRRYARLFESAAAIVAISDHIAERLADLGAPPERVTTLHLGVDVGRFPAPDRAGRRGPVRCLHVGRLTDKKAPVELIEAFAEARRLLAGEPPLHLVVAGDGELAGACETRVRELGLGGCVELRGAVPHGAVPGLMAEADVYTQHCRTAPDGDMEGLGVVFMEAAAAGLPVVSTWHDGIPEIVEHGVTGLLVPEGDVHAMARAIADLAADPAQRRALGEAGRARAERAFTLDRWVGRFEEIARSVAGAGATARSRRRASRAAR